MKEDFIADVPLRESKAISEIDPPAEKPKMVMF